MNKLSFSFIKVSKFSSYILFTSFLTMVGQIDAQEESERKLPSFQEFLKSAGLESLPLNPPTGASVGNLNSPPSFEGKPTKRSLPFPESYSETETLLPPPPKRPRLDEMQIFRREIEPLRESIPGTSNQLMPRAVDSHMVTEPSVDSNNFYYFARSNDIHQRGKAAAYLKDLAFKNTSQAQSIINQLAHSENMEERGTASRTLFDLVSLTPQAQPLVGELAKSVNLVVREVAAQCIAQLLRVGHQGGYDLFNFLAYSSDKDRGTLTENPENNVPFHERDKSHQEEVFRLIQEKRSRSLTVKEALLQLVAQAPLHGTDMINRLIYQAYTQYPADPLSIGCEAVVDLLMMEDPWALNTFASLLESDNNIIRSVAGGHLQNLVLSYDSAWAKRKILSLLSSPQANGHAIAIETLRILIECKNLWAMTTLQNLFDNSDATLQSVSSEILGTLIGVPIDLGKILVKDLADSKQATKRKIAVNALSRAVQFQKARETRGFIGNNVGEIIRDFLDSKSEEEIAIALLTFRQLLKEENEWARNKINKFAKSDKLSSQKQAITVISWAIQDNNTWAKTWISKNVKGHQESPKQAAILILKKLIQEDNKWARDKVNQFAKSPKTQEKEIAESVLGR
ncbi:MAG: hypothetical protein K0M45_05640 [Candidatus Paracaedibacteraceae bacterium]|nr:hypothetical protein [Candidatus Paracaedibacteraceae bacterium]